MNITFIRHAKPSGIDNFDDISYDQLYYYIYEGKKIEIDSIQSNIYIPDSSEADSAVFCSEYKRAQQSSILSGFQDFRAHYGVNEIDVDLPTLLTQEEYLSEGFVGFRKKMYECFFMGGIGVESKSSVQKRFDDFLGVLSLLPEKNIIVFSHGFFMNVVKASVALDKKIVDLDIDDYNTYIKSNRFGFLEHFTITLL